MSEKYISNQREYIISLFKNILNLEITEENFKYHFGDEAVYFSHKSRQLYLYYNDTKDMFYLMHLNSGSNPSSKNRWHIQRYEKFLPLIFNYLDTCHDWKERLEKRPKSKMELLFDSIEEQRKKDIEKREKLKEDDRRRKELIDTIHSYHDNK